MKRAISLILVLLLTLAVAGCGGGGDKDVDVSALAKALAEGVAFSETLKELPADQLGNYLDLPDGAQAAAYMGKGVSMEEIFVVRCSGKNEAAAVKTAAESLLANQIDAVRPYQPESVPRLENPVLVQKGSCVVLCVTDDIDTAEQIIKEHLG